MERLQHLLLKVHMIVEEAEGRCITNSKMLLQLKKIMEAMYKGYHVLDIIKHRTLCSSLFEEEVEKQQIINILMQDNIPPFAPTVLPIIGPSRVGKRTLVADVCNNEIVRSHFSSILHLTTENIWKMEHATFRQNRDLVVVEFTADIDDDNWKTFYASCTHMARGSKIIIVSKIRKLSRFGTVRPIHLNSLSLEEYSYLFKVLAFGSINPEEHPRLASIANEMSVLLGGSFITANVCADMFRKNQNVHFWLHVLKKYRTAVQNNFTVFREHPKLLMEKDHQIDITKFVSSPSPLLLMPPCDGDEPKRELSKVMFGDLIAGTAVLPKEDFELIAWESRLPPYRRFAGIATYYDDKNLQYTALTQKKRRRLDK
uniref:NB-ARC domain-containing protein n=1 Tax=Leersia perrieri TaxID=77586 RepID=A0A0D9XHL1_9ORYZ